MKFTAPIPFKEALDAHEVKSLLPTTGRTADLQQLSGQIKRRALFSSTVQSVELLQKIKDSTNAVLTGQSDEATQRLGIKQLLAEMGYQPDPEKIGGLQDLSSTARINLQIDTNVDVARGFGWDQQGQQSDVLDEWPAQELVQDFVTASPRGSSGRPGDLSWPERFVKAGGTLIDGRMIALINDPVWARLGDPALFADGLGNAWAPFAFNSGWGLRAIARDEAEQLGLIDPNQEVFPRDLSLNAELQASPDVRDDMLRALLEESGLGAFDATGVFKFGGNGP